LQGSQSLAQQLPLDCRQSRHLGQLAATRIAALSAQPVGIALPDAVDAPVDIGVEPEQGLHRRTSCHL